MGVLVVQVRLPHPTEVVVAVVVAVQEQPDLQVERVVRVIPSTALHIPRVAKAHLLELALLTEQSIVATVVTVPHPMWWLPEETAEAESSLFPTQDRQLFDMACLVTVPTTGKCILLLDVPTTSSKHLVSSTWVTL